MIKKSLFFLLLLSLPLLGFAQAEFDISYGYSRPMGHMTSNIKAVHGMSMGGMMRVGESPFAVGLDLSLGGYGYQSEPQTYVFSDGSTTETNVNVSNNVFSLALKSRAYLSTSSIIQPYLQLRGGFTSFYTSLVIEDPEDIDGCKPLESETLKSSTALFAGVGVGTRICLDPDGRYAIDISSNYTAGGRVNYMSLKKGTPTMPPSSNVMADFVNVQNQVVHKHHVGYIYNSPIRLLDWRIGFSFRF